MDRSHWRAQELIRAYARLMLASATRELTGYEAVTAEQLRAEIGKRRKRKKR